MFFGCFVCFVEILQNTRKTPQNTRKTPQNTRKTTQNTTKHHKTHLLTKQLEFANKPALAPYDYGVSATHTARRERLAPGVYVSRGYRTLVLP